MEKSKRPSGTVQTVGPPHPYLQPLVLRQSPASGPPIGENAGVPGSKEASRGERRKGEEGARGCVLWGEGHLPPGL